MAHAPFPFDVLVDFLGSVRTNFVARSIQFFNWSSSSTPSGSTAKADDLNRLAVFLFNKVIVIYVAAESLEDAFRLFTSRIKNSELSNREFTDKKKKYFKSSVNVFPNVVRVMQYADWTPDVLEGRQKQLVDMVMENFK